ncbi:unnamed protein product [Oikopleura dioica]|uniref:MARVEL domain-containing protein n=1 Tax=Oikopleura dioica TaxID=34765 RepID=E4XV32_OIKDI|nr:unnamed protein product [Oikopleura dioica]
MDSQYMPEGAYGGGLGGDAFDPFAYIYKPRTWVRGLCFGISLFLTISTSKTIHETGCAFGPTSLCSAMKFFSIFALVLSILLIILDVLFNKLTSVSKRKKAILAEGGLTGGIVFMFFMTFFVCAIRWAAMDENPPNTSAVNSSLFLLFLAVAAWGSSGFFVFENYKEGVQINFASGYIDPDQGIPNQFAPNQSGTDGILDGPEDSYQTQQQEQYLRLDE